MAKTLYCPPTVNAPSPFPETWSCTKCEWEGGNPTIFFDFAQRQMAARNPISFPTCPNCNNHNFYIFKE